MSDLKFDDKIKSQLARMDFYGKQLDYIIKKIENHMETKENKNERKT